MIILLSVPHTGTRFTREFLRSIKVMHEQYHTERSMLDEITHLNSTTALVPIRDPLLAYTSTVLRSNDYNGVLNYVAVNYKLLLMMEGALGTETEEPKPWFTDIHYFRLNAEDQALEMRKAADFCGYDGPIDFVWKPVGNEKPEPTSYAVWEIISDHFPRGEKEKVLETLKPFREYYGYAV